MKRFLIALMCVLCSVSAIMAQGRYLGQVTAITDDRRHSITGSLMQYTDVYGTEYLELKVSGVDKPMVVKEIEYAPYEYQYYAYLGSRDLDMPILNESSYYYFNFKIPLKNPGRYMGKVNAIKRDGKLQRTFRIYQYREPTGRVYYEAEFGPGNRRKSVSIEQGMCRYRYNVMLDDLYFFNFPKKPANKPNAK